MTQHEYQMGINEGGDGYNPYRDRRPVLTEEQAKIGALKRRVSTLKGDVSYAFHLPESKHRDNELKHLREALWAAREELEAAEKEAKK